ncbi:TerC/Alx family metal homeostasis membrane protein [Arcanobacterium haemolyticum]|nr:TerC/Alx family metal homeostasis membrane protein [Arcanobacterium haemolyticum]
MHVYGWEWGALIAIVVGLISVDLVGHVRKPHEPTMKEAARWLLFYISLAVIFGVYMIFRHSPEFSLEFFATYFTEYSLSIDNIFIFIIIIGSFRVPRAYQQKVLLYGIVIALVLRLVFILLGAALLERFSWLFFIFAAFLLWTAYSQVKEGLAPEEEANPDEYEPNAVTRFAQRIFRVTDGFVGDKLVTRRESKSYVTPMFLCILAIGSADLMFALDSIPASFGLTSQPFIVFAANAFALMGLRQLFFLVDGLLDRLIYLHFGLAAILGFIGIKLVIEAFHGLGLLHAIPAIPPLVSLGIIVVIILITVVASLAGAKKKESRGE